MTRRAATRREAPKPPPLSGRERRRSESRDIASPPGSTTDRDPAQPAAVVFPEPPVDAPVVHAADLTAPDRRRLQAEMIEMRERYRDGAAEAAINLEKFQELSARVKTLLDEEFVGWEADPEERRSDMVTLYFQYQADAERAATIQEKFERLTRDIEILLSEEFPDWTQ